MISSWKLYELYVELEGIEPRIWRRILVLRAIKLPDRIQQRGLLRRLLKMYLFHNPLEILTRLGLRPFSGSAPLAQQKLPQPVARTQLILLRRLARSHQVAQRLMGRIRHPHRRQVSGAIQRASLSASRRSVLTRSPSFTGICIGTTTLQSTPRFVSCQYNT